MGELHIKDICRILKIKPHIIRYWEKEIKEIAPRKDLYGVRFYTYKDLNTLFRIRYLSIIKDYNISQIKDQLYKDLNAEIQNNRTLVQEIRSDLIKLQEKLRNSLIK
jgi:DNA-binding transcriptional MerR regulator